ncbi:hypothetical protein QBC40DRAFT_232138 [Triangularia verruculosa]|uniref:Septin-type G domain-containing protein n=1 Tax=Triangularia verruculosa TaxID=2587418 RepID=A0AAN7ATZ2_9PEZI|nr:hypothetical protein QBC40DRAFT_232138 [Triangularia verruculosa]
MRPLPGDDAFGGRPRTSATAADSDTPAFLNMPSAPQMTYFFADEASIGDSSASRPAPFHHPHHRSKENNRRFPSPDHPDHYSHHIPKQYQTQPPRSSPFQLPQQQHEERDVSGGGTAGARSISSSSKGKAPVVVDSGVNFKADGGVGDDLATPMPVNSNAFPKLSSAPPPPPPPLSATSNSRPTTPFLSAGPASTLGSISSRRNSLSLSSAPSVDGTDYDEQPYDPDDDQLQDTETMESSGSAPQLIMPSIKMPSRRPFTEEGKQMGRLKVLIAGDSGVGKTSLIKAVVQSCESVVHVDPIVTAEGTGLVRSLPVGGKRGKGKGPSGETKEITEVWASTKPYPEWWSELEGESGLVRRKSLGDEVLDRNVCFVDTMGYGFGSSSMDTITPVTEYIQSHLQRISAHSLSDGDVLNMLGGEGGVQVDVVFYMVSNRLRPVDVHYLRQLSPLTNIIILLAQTDLMSADQVAASKQQIYSQLKEANIRLFSFNTTNPEKQGVYAISSANGSDHDNMDASLLMSPDYVQPLFPTELATLVEQVFNKDGISRLRHAAARKYVQWRKDQSPSPPSLSRRSLSISSSFSQHSVGGSQVFNGLRSPPSYALASITDHTQREERLAQVRFANWAADLQKSIATERAQYLALARGDRALWLTERLNECIQEGSLVPVNSRRHRGRSGSDGLESQRHNVRRHQQQVNQVRQVHGEGMRKEKGQGQQQQQQNMNHDPLGLLEVAADLRRKGLVVLEVLGSIGVLGGLAVWVVDRWVHVQALGWVWGEVERFWCGRL